MLRSEGPIERTLRLLYVLAALSFLPVLHFYYVGEEAIFPISSLEMWREHSWLVQIMYGANLKHNPLFNWLIMLFSDVAGWNHVLAVARALSILATLCSSWVLFWLARRFSGDRPFALFAALTYLTFSDVALYHGWLAYVDPLFAFFVFSSIALLWAASEEASLPLLALSAAALSLAFLSKAFTAYVFYGIAALVLLSQPKCRRFLLSAPALALAGMALAFPLFWLSLLPSQGQGGRMFAEILAKLAIPGLQAYVVQLASFPLEAMLRMAPVSLIVLYYLLRGRVVKNDADSFHLNTAFWIGLLNLLPYWLSPQSGIRYILPIYPFFALVFAGILWRTDAQALKISLRWIGGFLALKLVLFLFLFPWYQSHYRGENYLKTAQEIMRETAGFPLYVTDVSSSGLSVAGYLDVLRLPQAPLVFPPAKWDSGYVISYTENPSLGKIYRTFQLGGDRMFLLCRGDACKN